MHICAMHHSYMCLCSYHTFFDGYCSTVQGLLDWFEVGFTERTHVRKKKIAFARAYVCHDSFYTWQDSMTCHIFMSLPWRVTPTHLTVEWVTRQWVLSHVEWVMAHICMSHDVSRYLLFFFPFFVSFPFLCSFFSLSLFSFFFFSPSFFSFLKLSFFIFAFFFPCFLL